MLDPDLLKKYLADQLSEKERRAFLRALQRAESSDLPPTVVAKLWQDSATDALLSADQSAQLSRNFSKRLADDSTTEKQVQISPVWYRAAAAVALLLVSAVLWFGLIYDARTVHATAYGEIRTIVLPDSSVVTLNAHSTLRYAEPWDPQQPREVWLDGEAFFSVVHTHNDQRFQVHLTDNFRVEVLGTEFNVKNRRDEAEVFLQTGRVQLDIEQADRARRITMQPGDLVEFSEGDQVLTQQSTPAEQHTAWRDRRMMFEEMPLAEVALALEDLYGVNVVIDNPELAQTRLTGAFPTRNLDMILTALPTIVDMKIIRNEDEIILKNR